jgi:hypothetical protein
MSTGPSLTARAAALVAALVVGTVTVGVPLDRLALGQVTGTWASVADGPLSAVPFESLVSGLAGATVLVSGAWWGALLCLQVVAELVRAWAAGGSGRGSALGPALSRRLDRFADRLTPLVLRRVVTACLGVTVVAGGVAPATADVAGANPPGLGAEVLTGLSLPDRTTGTLDEPAPVNSPAGRPATTVVVRPGDSLWTIAASHLPGDASLAETVAAVDRLYVANRSVVGRDRDLVLPGTSLVLPHLHTTDRKDRP